MAEIIATNKKKIPGKLIIALGLGVFLLTGLVVAYLLYSSNASKQAPTATQETVQQKITRLKDEASRAIGTNQATIIEEYTTALQGETNTQNRQELLWGRAYSEMQNGKLDQALADALEADKLVRAFKTVDLIANIYQQQGNKAKAIEYYKLVLGLLPNDDESSTDRATIESTIKQLQEAQ